MTIVFCTLHVRRSAQAVSLAAGCLAAALPADIATKSTLLDFFPEQDDQEILSAVLTENPDMVAFPVYVWNRGRVLELARKLRLEQPDILLVAGGPEVTGNPQRLMQDNVWTALIHGEGEAAFAGLVSALLNKSANRALPGVTLMTPSGPLAGQKASPCDMSTMPSPWLTGLLQPNASGGVLWEVARGCAFSCDYCFDSRGHAGVRALDHNRLEKELALFRERSVSQVWVLDSTFNYPPERGVSLLKMLLRLAPEIHYHLEAKIDFVDRHTASLLGQLHCSVQVGLQSVSESVLRAIHRPIDIDCLAAKVHLLEAEGVTYGFDLIYGLPEDDYAGFCASIDAALGFAPNHVHIFPLAVLPGTRLAQQRERYAIQAQMEPPYELVSSNDWSVEDMARSRRLAAAVDIFYNTGRAVAFFPAILQALKTQPSELLIDFYHWAIRQPGIGEEHFLDSASWSADDVYRMLQNYLCRRLKESGQEHLSSLFLDLLCYHFHYAETLLGEELSPLSDGQLLKADLWEIPWQRTSKYRLVPFAYEILDFMEMEGVQFEELANLFRPVGSVALFMRRDNEVICESLGEDLLRLLQQSNGTLTPREIFAGSLSRTTGMELVEFAVSEGLLQTPPGVHAT